MKKEDTLNQNIEIYRNISSLSARADKLKLDNSKIEQAFNSREIFWDTQKDSFDRLMASLMVDINELRHGFSENIVFTEIMISDFRNKVKAEKVELLKRNLESWKVEEFVTQKRFSELVSKELNASRKKS